MIDRRPTELVFHKSSFSDNDQYCVEVAVDPTGGRWLRDTKDRTRPAHYFTEPEWTAFLAGVRAGEFD